MLSINIEQSFGEKISKELATSIEYILKYIASKVNDKITNKNLEFTIQFNTGERFAIIVKPSKVREINADIEYYNQNNKETNEIPLQVALNVCNYATSIEDEIDKYIDSRKNVLKIHYKTQRLDEAIGIFLENKINERNQLNNDIHSISVRSINERMDRIKESLDSHDKYQNLNIKR